MELIEIIRWVSIVLLWVCIGLNYYAIHRLIRTRKNLEKLEVTYQEAIDNYHEAIDSCNEARKAYEDRLKMVLGDVSDEGSDNDKG